MRMWAPLVILISVVIVYVVTILLILGIWR